MNRSLRLFMLVVFGVLLVGHVIFAWRYPIVVTPDSTYYLDGARHLAETGSFAAYNERFTKETDRVKPIVDFPPGYSAAIAVPMRLLGLEALSAAKLVNILSYLVFIACWVNVYRCMFGGQSPEFALGCLFLGLDSGFSFYINVALSETLFAAALGLMANGLFLALRDPSGKGCWFGLALIAAAGSALVLTRNVGVGFVPGVAAGLFLALKLRGERILRASVKALAPCVVAALFFGWWCYRNLSYGDQAVFVPYEPETVASPLRRVAQIFGWFNVSVLGIPLKLEIVALLFWLPLGMALAGFFSLRKTGWGNRLFQAGGWWLPLTLGVYTAVVLTAGLVSNDYNVNSGFVRYFSVLQPLLVGILLAVWHERATLAGGSAFTRLAAPAAMAVLAVSLVGGALRQTFVFSNQARRSDQEHRYAEFLRPVPPDSPLISNEARRLVVLTGRPARHAEVPGDILKLPPGLLSQASAAHALFFKTTPSRPESGDRASLRADLARFGTVLAEDEELILVRLNPRTP